MKLKICPVFYRIPDRSKPPGYIYQTEVYDANVVRHFISQVMKLPVSKTSFSPALWEILVAVYFWFMAVSSFP